MSIFRKRRSPTPNSAPLQGAARVPDGWRIYAFGDPHGRLDLLQRLRLAIDADLRASAPASRVIVGLGDYVDRGPDSRGVVELLCSGLGLDAELVCLRGNHEELLLEFVERPTGRTPIWLNQGGLETLRSYGVPSALLVDPEPDPLQLRAELMKRIPAKHLEFLSATQPSYSKGDYFFAHAGVRPGTPLDEQETGDLLWIKREFTEAETATEKVVVHGHSPVDKPYFGPFRINIDTGAYASNRLTCVVLEADTRRLIES